MVLNLHLSSLLINSLAEGSPLCDVNFPFFTHFLRTQLISISPSTAGETILKRPRGTFRLGWGFVNVAPYHLFDSLRIQSVTSAGCSGKCDGVTEPGIYGYRAASSARVSVSVFESLKEKAETASGKESNKHRDFITCVCYELSLKVKGR